MIRKLVTICLTLAMASTSLAAGSVYAPITDAESKRCERDLNFVSLIHECQQRTETTACYELYNSVLFAIENGQTDEQFATKFEGLDSSYRDYMRAMRNQFWQDLGRYPLRLSISAALWAIDAAIIYFFWASPYIVVGAHLLGWTISILMWGNEGSRILAPCSGLDANASEEQLQNCQYAINDRIKEFKDLNYTPRLPKGHLQKTKDEQLVMSYRLVCAMNEQILQAYIENLDVVGCEDGKVWVDGVAFDPQPDGTLIKEDQWWRGRIAHGEFNVIKRGTQHAKVPGSMVHPSWSKGVKEITKLYYPKISAVTARCLRGEY